jgi:hypothetical protein
VVASSDGQSDAGRSVDPELLRKPPRPGVRSRAFPADPGFAETVTRRKLELSARAECSYNAALKSGISPIGLNLFFIS